MNLEEKIGYLFQNKKLLEQAMTHKSFCFEKGSLGNDHNEVLEFLGDSVLGLALAVLLIRRFPQDNEGVLSKKRASLENEAILGRIAGQLDLGSQLRMGKGEKQSGGAQRPRILAGCFEALLGAIVHDGGFEDAVKVIEPLFEQIISHGQWEQDFDVDYKTRFQEVVQKKYGVTPFYRVIVEEGPAHAKSFVVELSVREEILSQGTGSSKKVAEQAAAYEALVRYKNNGEA